MFELIFHSTLMFNIVEVVFLLAGVYVLYKKRLPAWFIGPNRTAIEGPEVLPVGWALVSAVPLAIILGLILSYFKIWRLLFILDPATIIITVVILIFFVERLKSRPDCSVRSNKAIDT